MYAAFGFILPCLFCPVRQSGTMLPRARLSVFMWALTAVKGRKESKSLTAKLAMEKEPLLAEGATAVGWIKVDRL